MKWAARKQPGSPIIRLTRWNGRINQPYADGDVDFIVGYDLYRDRAHVLAWEEVCDKKNQTMTRNSEECWAKVFGA